MEAGLPRNQALTAGDCKAAHNLVVVADIPVVAGVDTLAVQEDIPVVAVATDNLAVAVGCIQRKFALVERQDSRTGTLRFLAAPQP